MATNKIIDNASSIELGHTLSLAQVKSDGGIRRAQRRGPYLYNFNVGTVPMNVASQGYEELREALINANYGVNTIATQMPSGLVYSRGTWAGTPLVNGGSQTGTSVTIDGFESSTVWSASATYSVNNVVSLGVIDTGVSLNSDFPFGPNSNQLQFGSTGVATTFMTAVLNHTSQDPITVPDGFQLRVLSDGTPQDFGGATFTRTNNVVTVTGITIEQELDDTGAERVFYGYNPELYFKRKVAGTTTLSPELDPTNWEETASQGPQIRAGDWVQFTSSTKVYQVTADAAVSGSGAATIILNTPLISSPDDNSAITSGNDVEFKLAIVNPDSVDPSIGSDLIARFGTFNMEEVL